MQNLTLAEKIAQMVIVRTSGYLYDYQLQYPQWEANNQQLNHWIKDLGIGGVILLGGNAPEVSIRTQQLQSLAKYPLLIAADIEEGVGQRFPGASWFPPPMALSQIYRQNKDLALNYARQLGQITAQEAQAIGLNWIYGPVADINNNPANPVINVRSFGDTPEIVTDLIIAFIEGTKDYPVFTCVKHFPGHGDTAIDSHLTLPIIEHDYQRLKTVELKPFQSAINYGVEGVMTGHLFIPAIDRQFPTTFSRTLLTDELRHNMGFKGLIVTDALTMGAITEKYGINAAPVLAVAAGADIILMPIDPPGAIKAVTEAVESGQIPESQIDESLERIQNLKQKLNPQQNHFQNLQPDQTQSLIFNIHQDSLIVRGNIPQTPISGHNVVIVDDILNSPFLNRTSPAITQPTAKGYQLRLINRYHPAQVDDLDSPAILQIFVRGNPFQGSTGILPIAVDVFKQLRDKGLLQAIIIYGSPYIIDQFQAELPAEIPCIFSYGQIPTAQSIALKALFGGDQAEYGKEFTD